MTTQRFLSLQLDEARARVALLDVEHYDVRLDLTGDDTFRSVTTVGFTSLGGDTFVDLKPLRVHSLRLNGRSVDPDLLDRGRLPISTVEGANELVVDAEMRFRNDGEGLHLHEDPADGRRYVYGMSFMDAAPSIFACFDQPDLKAPYTFHVTAPRDWVVIGNAPADQVEPGVWELETTRPLSTYFVTLVAGPYHVIRDEHDGIPLGLSARQSIASSLEADAEDLLTVTRQCFDELHRLFGIRYPFGNYHQAFVPEFNAGAMENPGCVTFRDPMIFTSRVTRGSRIIRATTIGHEMAHQWFGNITTPAWWDDLWLNESFAEYLGNRIVADATEYDDAWTHNAYVRRQWGLIADAGPVTHPVAGNGAVDAVAALQDFDGISYAKGSSILRQLNTRLGDQVFLGGVIDHLETHRFGNATMDDLFTSWEKAGAVDLREVTDVWLRTAGADAVTFDRAAGEVRRTPPDGEPTSRTHAFHVAHAGPDATWTVSEVEVGEAPAPLPGAADHAVVIDSREESWLLALPDEQTLLALPDLLPRTTDPLLRAATWNNVRTGFEHGLVDPARVIELAAATIPQEPSDDPLAFNVFAGAPSKLLLTEWLISKVAPLTPEPLRALADLHAASLTRARTAEAGSTLQLAAFQGAISSAVDHDVLRSWLAGDAPDGVEIDAALRWRILIQLAAMGAVDRSELDEHLEREPTATTRVDHSRAVASLPDAAAKSWAWDRFLGVEDVANYELQASGQGMWRPGQEAWTEEYVDRFLTDLPRTSAVRSGWVLAESACWYFPLTSTDPDTVTRAEALAADESLAPSLRRQVRIMADELRRRQAVRERFSAR